MKQTKRGRPLNVWPDPPSQRGSDLTSALCHPLVYAFEGDPSAGTSNLQSGLQTCYAVQNCPCSCCDRPLYQGMVIVPSKGQHPMRQHLPHLTAYQDRVIEVTTAPM